MPPSPVTLQCFEELYDLTTAYPDLDLEPYLVTSTPFFQTYVQQALYNVGLQRAAAKASSLAGEEYGGGSASNGIPSSRLNAKVRPTVLAFGIPQSPPRNLRF